MKEQNSDSLNILYTKQVADPEAKMPKSDYCFYQLHYTESFKKQVWFKDNLGVTFSSHCVAWLIATRV